MRVKLALMKQYLEEHHQRLLTAPKKFRDLAKALKDPDAKKLLNWWADVADVLLAEKKARYLKDKK